MQKTVAEGILERSGRLYIRFRFNGQYITEKYRKSSAPNIKAAIRKRMRILDEIEEGSFDYESHFPEGKNTNKITTKTLPKSNSTVSERLAFWLNSHKVFVEESTLKSYRLVIKNHINPFLGDMLVTDITLPIIKDYAGKLVEGGRGKKTITEAFIPLRKMLDDIVSEGLLPVNPTNGIKLKNIRTHDKVKETDDIDPFSCREIELILAALNGPMRNFFQFALTTGLRTSELIALQWGDIDWTRKPYPVLRVRRAKVLRKIKSTKTRAGTRDVALFPRAVEALMNQKQYTFMKAVNGEGYIFHHPKTDNPFSSDKAPRETYWIPALLKAGVRYRYPYQCRHTLISHLLIQQTPITKIARMVGHVDGGMIIRHYSRWIEEEPNHEHYAYWELQNGGSELQNSSEKLNVVTK